MRDASRVLLGVVAGSGLLLAAAIAGMGTTAALWSAQEPLPGVVLTTGTIGLDATVEGEASGTLVPGGSITVPITLHNSGLVADGGVPVEAKVTSATVTGGPGMVTWLQLRVDAGACPTAPTAATSAVGAYASSEPLVSLGPEETGPGCIVLSLPTDDAVPDLQGQDATVEITLTGTQVRPG